MILDFFGMGLMIRPKVYGAACLLVLLFLFASPVYAHKVHIFAYVDGNLIKTESRFNGGRPAQNCGVHVQALDGQDEVARGQSDAEGLFAFPVPGKADDLDIIITCGDGHRGSWRLEALEYLPSEEQAASPGYVVPPAQVAQAAPPVEGGDERVLRKIIAEEVEKKMAPLRRDLARLAEKKTSLQDILGGIGYILGLAGLAAYLKFKKTK